MKLLLLAAFGGALGSALRYAVTLAGVRALGPAFPWGTLFVNVTGSFIMGLLAAAFASRWGGSEATRVFLTTGILGGYTTFSAFSLDVANLIEQDAASPAYVYAGASVALSLLAVFAGVAAGRAWLT